MTIGRLRTVSAYVALLGLLLVGITVAMVAITVKDTGLSDSSFHAGLYPLLAGLALMGIGCGGFKGFAGSQTDTQQSGDQSSPISLPLSTKVLKVVAGFVALLGLMLVGVTVVGVVVGWVQFGASMGGGALVPFVAGCAFLGIGVAVFNRLDDGSTDDAVDMLYKKRYTFAFWTFVLILVLFIGIPRMSDTRLPEPIWQWVSWFVFSDGPLG